MDNNTESDQKKQKFSPLGCYQSGCAINIVTLSCQFLEAFLSNPGHKIIQMRWSWGGGGRAGGATWLGVPVVMCGDLRPGTFGPVTWGPGPVGPGPVGLGPGTWGLGHGAWEGRPGGSS